MSDTTPQSKPAASAGADSRVLDEIATLTDEIRLLRKKQIWVNVGGILLILITLCIFFYKITMFGLNFDQAQLASDTFTLSSALVRDPEVAAVQNDFKTVFMPELKKQFSTQLNQRLPAFEELFRKETGLMIDFMHTTLRDHVVNGMNRTFKQMEEKLEKKYGKDAEDTAALEHAFKEMESKLAVKLSDSLEKKLEKAQESLSSLNHSINLYKDTPDYKKLSAQHSGEVENRLLESFLELWIYSLNPERGNASAANANGGI